ncbi:mechanosensitive ion channel protein 10-like [Dorcoceras hygrometricum]|uniref:Mechanosensitive ion channel protein 10-like n=1 Tax=Dorcoceras hygrometricum TaxID=472368 RepID=A0A2Z7A491_9LAMI|nr:mechanosensitive ion channel protein 10-like [Dorcoceras hygrometricum]
MSLFDLQDVRIAIGSIATLDLPMVVDLIGIYGLKGPYCTLTTTNWFLQALSVIPRGSWGDVARRSYHDQLGKSGIVIPEPQWLWARPKNLKISKSTKTGPISHTGPKTSRAARDRPKPNPRRNQPSRHRRSSGRPAAAPPSKSRGAKDMLGRNIARASVDHGATICATPCWPSVVTCDNQRPI